MLFGAGFPRTDQRELKMQRCHRHQHTPRSVNLFMVSLRIRSVLASGSLPMLLRDAPASLLQAFGNLLVFMMDKTTAGEG